VVTVAIASFFLKQTNLSFRQFVAICIFSLFVLVLGYLAITGRLHWLVATGAALLPLLRRLPLILRAIPLVNQLRGFARRTARPQNTGQSSKIQTRFFAMSLEHDSGDMDGEILQGSFRGHLLSSLSRSDLMVLYDECESDMDSLQVFEAWLDRYHADWREQYRGRDSSSSRTTIDGDMSEQEALNILGLDSNATRDNIIEAHRRLMQKLHPDHGGSTYLAAKLNQAKDFLLG
jgi:hypothetical protein